MSEFFRKPVVRGMAAAGVAIAVAATLASCTGGKGEAKDSNSAVSANPAPGDPENKPVCNFDTDNDPDTIAKGEAFWVFPGQLDAGDRRVGRPIYRQEDGGLSLRLGKAVVSGRGYVIELGSALPKEPMYRAFVRADLDPATIPSVDGCQVTGSRPDNMAQAVTNEGGVVLRDVAALNAGTFTKGNWRVHGRNPKAARQAFDQGAVGIDMGSAGGTQPPNTIESQFKPGKR